MRENFDRITSTSIRSYCEAHSSFQDTYLEEVALYTQSVIGKEKMLSGQYLGQFLKMMTMTLNAKKVLEIGTFTGYGTLCMKAGLPDGGVIHTIELNPVHYEAAQKHLSANGLGQQVISHLGDAAVLISKLDLVWDLVFIDAAKRQYVNYFDLILPKLRPGGVILADNVLWKGKILNPGNDKLCQGLDAFNKKVHQDERVENLILAIDDGVHFIIKK